MSSGSDRVIIGAPKKLWFISFQFLLIALFIYYPFASNLCFCTKETNRSSISRSMKFRSKGNWSWKESSCVWLRRKSFLPNSGF
ncbi:hypothetical protein SLA2020_161990 [Shorea laevis]